MSGPSRLTGVANPPRITVDTAEQAWAWAISLGLVFVMLLSITAFQAMDWWIKGHAISRWIKATRQIDVPWYEATYLPVDTQKDFSIKAR